MKIDTFLAEQGWADAKQKPLAGDASTRRYIRLCSGSKRAILMIDPQGDTLRFARLAVHLRDLGLSAPEVYAHTLDLMLLEDFGDAQLAKVSKEQPDLERTLYKAATDVLCHLETRQAPKDLILATPEYLGQMIEPAFTHYLPLLGRQPDKSNLDLVSCLTDLMARHVPSDRVLVLRDYHAENMIWLPERAGVRRIGVLDFQDALCGPPIYDLVSMLQDARRDVSDACHRTTVAHYLDRSGRDAATVEPAFHLLGLQRNLRILGIFARLAAERGKAGYLSLIPRVWGHIQSSLASPVAKDLEPLVKGMFPVPTAERLTMKAVP